MKIPLITFLVCLMIVPGVFAQNASQTSPSLEGPSVLTYSAPKKEEIKEFVSKEDKFRVDFAGLPESKRDKEKGLAGYIVFRKGSLSRVAVTEISRDAEKFKNEIYQFEKKSLLELPDAKTPEETDVQISGKPGKQFTLTFGIQGMGYMKVRVLPIGNKIYELTMTATNWHLISDDTKKEFEAEAKRFFDSFKLLEKK